MLLHFSFHNNISYVFSFFNSYLKRCGPGIEFKKAVLHRKSTHANQLHASQLWTLTSTASRSWIMAAEAGGHFALSSPVLDPASGSWLACTAPGAFQMLSGSASVERNPTVFWPCSLCVLFQKSGHRLLSFLALGDRGYAFSPMRCWLFMSASLLRLKGEYKMPWMRSNKKQGMPNKSPVHFSLLQLEFYFTFSVLMLWFPPASGCQALEENTPTPCVCVSLSCWLISTNG